MSVKFDVNEIIDRLERTNDMISWYANTRTGELASPGDWHDAEEDDRDFESAEWVALPDHFAIDDWGMMLAFSLEQAPVTSSTLLDATHGRGAFRVFRRELESLGLMADWYEFQHDRYRTMAIEWLDANNLEWHDTTTGGSDWQVKRIAAMERALDDVETACRSLNRALRRYSKAQRQAIELSRYVNSEEWRTARKDADAGLLPDDLKREVLSDGAARSALLANRESALRLLDTAAGALRNA